MGVGNGKPMVDLPQYVEIPMQRLHSSVRHRLRNMAEDEKYVNFISSIVPYNVHQNMISELKSSVLTKKPYGVREDQNQQENKEQSKGVNSPWQKNDTNLITQLWKLSCDLNGTILDKDEIFVLPPYDKKIPKLKPIVGEKNNNKDLCWVVTYALWYGKNTHKSSAMFDPNIFNTILSFLGGDSALQCLPLVCTNWFILFYDLLYYHYAVKVALGFIETYNQYFELTKMVLVNQRLTTQMRGCRFDINIYARVIDKAKKKLFNIKHTYVHLKHENKTPKDYTDGAEEVFVPKSSTYHGGFNLGISEYKVQVFPQHSIRDLWVLTDRSRAHGNEYCQIGECSEIAVVNVEDFVEIPVNIVNPFAMVQKGSHDWLDVSYEYSNRHPPHPDVTETLQSQWMPISEYTRSTVERVRDDTLRYEPILKGLSAMAMGTAMAATKHKYIADGIGSSQKTLRELNHQVMVSPQSSALVVALKRGGLQNDYYRELYLRKGDLLTVYKISGGPLEF